MSQSERLAGMTDAKEFSVMKSQKGKLMQPCRPPPPCNQPRPPPLPCRPHPPCSCTRPDCRAVVEISDIAKKVK